MSFNEIPLTFGPDRNLMGTLTLPAGAPPKPVAFVLLNAGVIHRIGPHRINVKLARHLARQGFATLRFDLSGQGDSRHAASGADFIEQSVGDIRAAMDHLSRTTDVQRFAIAGICSGADTAWATAQVDPRVAGLWMLDGVAYTTARTRWTRLRRRLGGPILSAIGPAIKRRLAALASPSSKEVVTEGGGRPVPTREAFARTMQALVDRGVNVRLVYSGSLLPTYNHDSQFRDAFAGQAFIDRVRADYCPDMDHTVTPVAAQQAMLNMVADWARSL